MKISHFICPVCGNDLIESGDGSRLSCCERHSYDIAKSGYVNLLMSQKTKAAHHGDDRLMVRARRDFLDRGYYRILLDALCEAVGRYAKDGCAILDAGCGECWYTANIFEYLLEKGIRTTMSAVDISKDAAAAGARRSGGIGIAVASVHRLPVKSGSRDIVLSLFAPFDAGELGRVLKEDGVVIRALPLERHLLGLKAAVYDSVYENTPEEAVPAGFEMLEKRELKWTLRLESGEDIRNLFTMTPYYYKTGVRDQEKLGRLTELETEAEFGVYILRKARKQARGQAG